MLGRLNVVKPKFHQMIVQKCYVKIRTLIDHIGHGHWYIKKSTHKSKLMLRSILATYRMLLFA